MAFLKQAKWVLVVAGLGGCAQPTASVGRPSIATQPSPAVPTAPALSSGSDTSTSSPSGPEAEYTSKCSNGDGVACSLLASAYRDGTLLATDVVRDGQKYRFFAYRACQSGHLFSCLTVGAWSEKGEGVPQNLPAAAQYFSKVCEASPIEVSTKFGCADLGRLYLGAKGLAYDRKRGLALLKRSCDLGADHGCKLHDLHAGTGLVSGRPAPRGALGFAFEGTPDEARKACQELGGKWTSIQADKATCAATSPALGRASNIVVRFSKKGLQSISAGFPVTVSDAFSEFARLEDSLWKTYGVPSSRHSDPPSVCADDSGCFAHNSATLLSYWEFGEKVAITLSAGATSNGSLVLAVNYLGTEEFQKRTLQGL
jgi:hypothetical protein